MSRISAATLCVLAMFAASALATGTASASPCPENGVPTLCIELNTVAPGTYNFESKITTGTEARLEDKTLSLEIACTSAEDAGAFVQGTILTVALKIEKFEIMLGGCKILGELGLKCKLASETISLNGNNALKGLNGTINDAITEIAFAPAEGTVVTEVTIENVTGKVCSIKGKDKVTGTQNCRLLAPSTDGVEEPVECAPTGSNLLFAENAATLKLEEKIFLIGANKGREFTIELA